MSFQPSSKFFCCLNLYCIWQNFTCTVCVSVTWAIFHLTLVFFIYYIYIYTYYIVCRILNSLQTDLVFLLLSSALDSFSPIRISWIFRREFMFCTYVNGYRCRPNRPTSKTKCPALHTTGSCISGRWRPCFSYNAGAGCTVYLVSCFTHIVHAVEEFGQFSFGGTVTKDRNCSSNHWRNNLRDGGAARSLSLCLQSWLNPPLSPLSQF